jgi:hypothetical protein
MFRSAIIASPVRSCPQQCRLVVLLLPIDNI